MKNQVIPIEVYYSMLEKTATAADVRARMEMDEAQGGGRMVGAAIGLGLGIGAGLVATKGKLGIIPGLIGVAGGVSGGTLGSILAGRKHQKIYGGKPIPSFVHRENAAREEEDRIERAERAELRRKQFIAQTGGAIGGLVGKKLNRKYGNEDDNWKATVAGHGVGAIAANALRKKMEKDATIGISDGASMSITPVVRSIKAPKPGSLTGQNYAKVNAAVPNVTKGVTMGQKNISF